jgi:CheY-like chemotaxis protein
MENARASRVLVVEDEGIVREYLRFCLEDCGYNVLAAASVGEALAHSNEAPHIDLLLTDIHIVNASGIELATRIIHQHKDLRILFISGDAAQPSHSLPNAQFLRKPFTPDVLTRMVEALLATY